jgi:hypothetical protein
MPENRIPKRLCQYKYKCEQSRSLINYEEHSVDFWVGLVVRINFIAELNEMRTRLRAGRPEFDTGCGSEGIFSPCHRVQTDFEAHTFSCPMGNEGCFLGGKAVGT